MAEKQVLIDLKIETNYEKTMKNVLALNKAIDEQKEKQRELSQAYKEGKLSYEDYNRLMEEIRTSVTQLSEKQREYRKEIQNSIKTEKENEGSLKQLRATLSNLTSAYDKLSQEEREAAKGLELKKKINEVTKELKGAEEETGRFYRNVGNYAGALQSVLGENVSGFNQLTSVIKPFNDVIKSAGDKLKGISEDFKIAIASTKGMTVAQKSATVATAGLSAGVKALGIAMLSTPIGIIVAALGSLVAYLTRTQEGTEKLGRAFAGVKGAIDVFLDRIAKVGKGLSMILSGDFSKGVDEIITSFKGFGKELTEETKQAMALKDALTAIEKEEANLTAQQQATKVSVAELKRIADDTTKSTQERVKAAREALALEEGMAKQLNSLGERRIAIMLGYTEVTDEVKAQIEAIKNGTADADAVIKNLGLSESTIKDYQELTNAIALYQQRVAEFTQMQVEGSNKINTIIKESNSAAIAAEKALKDESDKLLNEQQKEEVERQAKMIQTRLELVKKGSEDYLKLKKEQLDMEMEEELASAKFTEEEKELIRQKYANRYAEEQTAVRNEIAQKQQEQLALELQNRLSQAQVEGASELELLKIDLENKKRLRDEMRQLEGESDAEFKARQLESEQNYIEAKNALTDTEIAIQQEKFEALSQLTGAISGLFTAMGEDSKAAVIASKITALAEVAINTGLAISRVTSAEAWKGLAGIATSTATIIQVIANMTSAIKSIKSAKFAEGGLVEGPGSGTSDSIPAMLSNGESVMTARATSMFAPVLSALNVAGGGVPISVKEKSSQTLGEDMLARAFAKGVENLHPVVSVEEINRVSNDVRVIQRLGNI